MREMRCKSCKFCGVRLVHLAGFRGYYEWRNCDYPLPYFAIPQAVPLELEHDCKVYEIISPNSDKEEGKR
jgi:hypothetical protein